MNVVELRCPRNKSRLFGVVVADVFPASVHLEIACRDCRREVGDLPALVLHRYMLDGTLIDTVVRV